MKLQPLLEDNSALKKIALQITSDTEEPVSTVVKPAYIRLVYGRFNVTIDSHGVDMEITVSTDKKYPWVSFPHLGDKMDPADIAQLHREMAKLGRSS